MGSIMLMSGLGGFLSHLIVYPFILARCSSVQDGLTGGSTRMAVDIPSSQHGAYRYKSALAVLSEQYHKHGLRGLYRGMPVSMTGCVSFVAVHYTLLRAMLDFLPKKNNGSGEVCPCRRSSSTAIVESTMVDRR